MARVLVVTDDPPLVKAVKTALRASGDTVVSCRMQEARDPAYALGQIDVAVLDLRAQVGGESEACRGIKRERRFADVPVVALLAGRQLEAFQATWGCDDYLGWPAEPAELRNRLRLTLYRARRLIGDRGLVVGDLAIDVERYEVRLNATPVELTFKEYELLRFLATHPGKVFTREALLDQVWGYDYYGGTRTVDVHIRRLRSKIEIGGREFIDTVRHVGYRFIEPAA